MKEVKGKEDRLTILNVLNKALERMEDLPIPLGRDFSESRQKKRE